MPPANKKRGLTEPLSRKQVGMEKKREMERKLIEAVCRNALETCGVIDAKAIVVVESAKGERFWAGNGQLRKEFYEDGRIMNSDDLEIDVAAHRTDLGSLTVVDSLEEEDLEEIDHRGLENGSGDPVTPSTNGKKGQKRKTEPEVAPAGKRIQFADSSKWVASSSSSSEAKKARKESAQSATPASAALKPLVEVATVPTSQLLKAAGLKPQMLWHGKNALQWVKIARQARQRAIAENPDWHHDHPPIADPDWHVMMYLRYRLSNNYIDRNFQTSPIGFWSSLKPRMICDGCLCFGKVLHIDPTTSFVKRKLHGSTTCGSECCGRVRCRVCGHAHGVDTRCVCSCWVDSLKAALIVSPKLDAFGHLPPVAGPSKVAVSLNVVAPAVVKPKVAEKANVTDKAKVAVIAEDAESAESAVDAARKAFAPESSSVGSVDSPSKTPKPSLPEKAEDSDDSEDSVHYQLPRAASKLPAKIVKAEMIDWRENDLSTNLQLAGDIIAREARKDHRPIRDLFTHLTLWLENAAAGRYSSFFSHVLVNGFCQGCCCFLNETSGSDAEADDEDDDDVVLIEDAASKNHCNKHTMADCVEKCCGEFLCKVCLHKHPIGADCECQCVVTVLDALGLLEDDAEKVQESTAKRWMKIYKNKTSNSIKKKVQQEIDDW